MTCYRGNDISALILRMAIKFTIPAGREIKEKTARLFFEGIIFEELFYRFIAEIQFTEKRI